MVYVHLATGYEEIEALSVVDFLKRADIDVKLVSVEDKLEVTGRSNITVVADLLFEDADYENCQMIVLPGGMPGTKNLQNHKGLDAVIDKFNEEKKYIAAICAAPMILGAKGLVEGIEATIYPGMEKHLAGALPCSEKVAWSGHIITSKGPGTAADFSLKLIEALKGKEKADWVKEDIVY